MTEEEVLQVLGKVGAVITNSHIRYTRGKHGSAYINKDAIYPHTVETSRLCRALAERFADEYVEAVIAPAIGGVILSHRIADHLTEMSGYEVLGVYAEMEEKESLVPTFGPVYKFVVRRGYDKLIAGKNVLVVEDVLNTGWSVKKVIEVTRGCGGSVVGVGVLCNRGVVTSRDLGVPLVSLVNIKLDLWDEATCPLCKQNVPINTDVSKGRELLARKRV